MAHRHNAIDGPEIPGGVQNRIEQRNQRSDAFERKSLRAQIARLQNLLEKVRAHQALENFLLIDLQLGPLDALRNPSPPLRLRQVHEFHADVAAVDAARFFSRLASQFQIGKLLRLENTKRIQRGFVIAPATKRVKYALALLVVRSRFLRPFDGLCGAL